MTGGGFGSRGQAGAAWASALRESTRPACAMIEATRRMIRLMDHLGEARRRQVEIATTPKDTVWREGKVTLSRYRPDPAVPERRLGPLVIVHGLVGRQSMTDLEPRRSLVRRLLAAGVDTFVLDWGNPTRADRYCDMTDYADHRLGDALEAAMTAAERPRAALLGICQGGVFAAAHAALYPERLSALALAVTPIDCHADAGQVAPGRGQLNVWLRSLPEDLVDRLIDDSGMVPGALAAAVFNGLTPGRTAAKYTADLMEIASDPDALDTFLRMEKWLSDRPDQPGALAREWLVDLYRENRLVEGRLALDGRPVRLSEIACPVLNIYARDDHIVPPPCSRALKGHLRNVAYRELEVPTGHVGAFVSPRGLDAVAPAMTEFLALAA
ncbi:MAG: alpha/beta fold hydrolase [Pseudomonadota bacterium]